MSSRSIRLIGTLAGIAIVAGAFAVARTLRSSDPMPDATDEFFRRYVEADGRVVRHDEGGDTVSEGQAYAMLLAVAAGDRERFDRVWTWTQRHLQRDDGLLSWRWQDGALVDDQPAADGDVDAAFALVLAADRFGRAGYAREARAIAVSMLTNEVVRVGAHRVLAAGPWAVERGIVNPSYLDLRAFQTFAERFDDARWTDVADGSRAVLERLASDGRQLPPDWVRVDGESVTAIAGPDDPRGPGRYGFDAPRALIRSSACRSTRDLAARWAPAARARAEADGAHPVVIVAAAAGAGATGDGAEGDRLLAHAADVARATPTYYGWAWASLGPLWLDGSTFDDCD